MQEELDELTAALPGMTGAELHQRLCLEYLRIGGATFDTRLLTAVKARLTELGESYY
jgi:hypothetical protein